MNADSVTRMSSQQHDIAAELFRWSPDLAGELLTEMGVGLPEVLNARDVSETFIDLKTREYSGDTAVIVDTIEGKHGVIVEVQRWPPTDKKWTWPLYIHIFRARHRCPVALLVLAPDPAIADRCEEPIESGHPNHVLVPLVVRPEHVPFLENSEEIVADLAMGVLSALFHGGGDRYAEVIKHAIEVTNLLGDNRDDRRDRYYDFILGVLPEVARKSLEAMMQTDSPYYSDVMRNAYARGEAEGKAEGVAEGVAEALLRVLKNRGVRLTGEERERILDCTDVTQLDIWLDRALDAKSADELFGRDQER